jgi:acyl-coenzyme A synthetase/AMP-(fatty) acid ligase
MIPAWGRTGDLAKMDEDGVLWYQGRSDDMFKSAGYRIGPARSRTAWSSTRRWPTPP